MVRLAQGDPARQTAYAEDPAAAARCWLDQGASWLHVINLDGALGGDDSMNMQALQGILKTAGSYHARVEFGGGIRREEDVRACLEAGVERIFLGTSAILDPALVERSLTSFGALRIAGDIGARKGKVVLKGWQEQTALTILEAGSRLRELGFERCVLTDVERDGVGAGMDVEGASALQKATRMQIVASGGASSLEDIRRVRAAGLAGVIIGRALYDGRLSLKECLTDG